MQKQNQLIGNIATQFIKLRALTIAKNAAEAQQREEETKDRAKAETFYYQVFLTNSYAPMKKSTPTFKFLLTLGLAVSLSGCAGFGTWNDSWNNITGGVRDYGQ
ncbi:MAG: hypothetical protein J6P47_02335, partial [Acetobacter sp.]|nr:hypothetical protein [Acetobacter sp.]